MSPRLQRGTMSFPRAHTRREFWSFHEATDKTNRELCPPSTKHSQQGLSSLPFHISPSLPRHLGLERSALMCPCCFSSSPKFPGILYPQKKAYTPLLKFKVIGGCLAFTNQTDSLAFLLLTTLTLFLTLQCPTWEKPCRPNENTLLSTKLSGRPANWSSESGPRES